MLQLKIPHTTTKTWSEVKVASHVWLFATPRTAAHQASCPSLIPREYSNSCPLSQWCHPTILSSAVPFSSYLQSFSASGSFQVSQFFVSVGQSIGDSALETILLMSIQDLLDLFAVQRTLKSLLQPNSLKASILLLSAFFRVQLSHPYMTTGKKQSFD